MARMLEEVRQLDGFSDYAAYGESPDLDELVELLHIDDGDDGLDLDQLGDLKLD